MKRILNCPQCAEPNFARNLKCNHCGTKLNDSPQGSKQDALAERQYSSGKSIRVYSSVNQTFNLPNGIPLQKLLGFTGAVVLFIGVFCPIISAPIIGSINYFRNGTGDGVVVLVLAVISVVLVLTKRYRGLLITGAGSIAMLILTFILFKVRMSSAQSRMKGEMADNPFSGIGEAFIGAVQIEWGWAVLVVGSCLLIAAGLIRPQN